MKSSSSLTCIEKIYCHGGWQYICEHYSQTTQTTMRFAVFLPSGYAVNISNNTNQFIALNDMEADTQQHNAKTGAVMFLSGLTCSWENVMTKGHVQAHCAALSLAFIAPDTSPRGDTVADDPAYDLGQGAGFYLNATQDKWKRHFRMYDYICDEIYALISTYFPIHMNNLAITGHSMGGHGALVIGMRNPDKFLSVSAFAPIVSPTRCPWGIKAFSEYLGTDKTTWQNYDACILAKQIDYKRPILIDQGKNDAFLDTQLHPHLFEEICHSKDMDLTLNLHDNYDHSYYFISTFMKTHLDFHLHAIQSHNTA